MQMIATGHVADMESARTLIKNSFEFKVYSPADADSWAQAYEEFKKLLG